MRIGIECFGESFFRRLKLGDHCGESLVRLSEQIFGKLPFGHISRIYDHGSKFRVIKLIRSDGLHPAPIARCIPETVVVGPPLAFRDGACEAASDCFPVLWMNIAECVLSDEFVRRKPQYSFDRRALKEDGPILGQQRDYVRAVLHHGAKLLLAVFTAIVDRARQGRLVLAPTHWSLPPTADCCFNLSAALASSPANHGDLRTKRLGSPANQRCLSGPAPVMVVSQRAAFIFSTVLSRRAQAYIVEAVTSHRGPALIFQIELVCFRPAAGRGTTVLRSQRAGLILWC